MTATTTELRIRAAELTDEHVGMDILSGTRWIARRRLDILRHHERLISVNVLGYDTLFAAPDAELVLSAPFARTDRHDELVTMLQWYARAYRNLSFSCDHMGIARTSAVAFAREALDAGHGGETCQRVIDLQIGPGDNLLSLALTGAEIPGLIREAGLEREARRITDDWRTFHWEMPSVEKMHDGIRQCDSGCARRPTGPILTLSPRSV